MLLIDKLYFCLIHSSGTTAQEPGFTQIEPVCFNLRFQKEQSAFNH